MNIQQESGIPFVCLVLIIAIAILMAAGCTDHAQGQQGPVMVKNETQSKNPTGTPAAAPQAATVSPVPTTRGCAYPPLNPWTWVPESYSSSGRTVLPPAPGTLVSKADLFGTPSLSWEEYANTQQITGIPDSEGITRIEMSQEKSGGHTITHENFTYSLHFPGQAAALTDTTIDDMYYDDYGNMQSDHRQVIRDGKILEDKDYPPVNRSGETPDCSGDLFTPKYAYTGTDAVTVPAGSYPEAMKYTVWSINDPDYSTSATVTYWFIKNIPVPVKWVINDPEKSLLFTNELKGWG